LNEINKIIQKMPLPLETMVTVYNNN